MASATLVTHEQVDGTVDCDGPLISTYLTSTKCGKCGGYVQRGRILDAQERTLDHQTFYEMALVLIEDRDGEEEAR